MNKGEDLKSLPPLSGTSLDHGLSMPVPIEDLKSLPPLSGTSLDHGLSMPVPISVPGFAYLDGRDFEAKPPLRARQAEGKTAAKAGGGEAELTQEEQDARDAKLRQKSLKATTEAITAVMDNSDGLARLKAISDEEWAEAEAKGNGTD